jgi:hypothetical protein
MFYDPQHLVDGERDLAELADDSKATDLYADSYIDSFSSGQAGILFTTFLSRHAECASQNHELIGQVRTLLSHASAHLSSTLEDYARTNNDARTDIRSIFAELDTTDTTPPLGPTPTGHGTRGPLPGSGLKLPYSEMMDPALFNILSWADWLSASGLIRKFINWVVNEIAPGTGDIFENLYAKLGGHWDQINKVSDAWSNIERYFVELSDELRARMQIMFEGWGGDDAIGAQQAGEYFSDVVRSLYKASDQYWSLARLYRDIAYASWGLFQALWAGIDAAVDAFVAAYFEAESIGALVLAVFTGGATAVPAAAAAIFGVVEAAASGWSQIMSLFYSLETIFSLLDAMLVDVQFVTLPEG